jgi:CMP-N,N'-diacetyllegionaminic acid synthase
MSSVEQNAIAIVLGRGGSRGLPGKNMLPVAGKPCVRWTIEHAQSASGVGLVAVSSDDPHLLALGAAMGATVLHRSAELASGTARIDDAAREALAQLEATRGKAFADRTPIVMLYANVPVRPHGLVDRAIARIEESAADSVQSYAAVGKHHPWWTVRVGVDNGKVSPWEGNTLFHNCFRRQDLPPAHIPDGGVMVVTRRALMLELDPALQGPHAFLGKDRRGILTSRDGLGDDDVVVDIDTRVDLLVADALLSTRGGYESRSGSSTAAARHVQ